MSHLPFKIILIGDGKVGKTALRNRYMGKGFETTYLMTLGADLSIKRVGQYKMHIWDIAGQTSFKAIRGSYYQGATAAILVYDVTNRQSFENVENWIDEVVLNNNNMVPTVIFANKIDLLKNHGSVISEVEVSNLQMRLKEQYSFNFPTIETSALSGYNVENAFVMLIKEILKNRINKKLSSKTKRQLMD